ncbi:MAG: acetyl-coenzyme A synthetase N-terminal domain-containing protein, partial [Acidimicrobiia bacterium]
MTNPSIEALSTEDRKFAPSDEFAGAARFKESVYEEGKDLEKFWAAQAEHVMWRTPHSQVLDWSGAPFAKWFIGATLNITESCLDKHLEDRADKVAYHWEGEPGDTRSITYREIYEDTCRAANALKSLGVEKGDRVAIYM